MDAPAHHVFSYTRAGAALDAHIGELVHAGRVIARVSVNRHLHWGVQTDRNIVGAIRVVNLNLAPRERFNRTMKALIDAAQALLRKVEA